jgi:hypothetical protein
VITEEEAILWLMQGEERQRVLLSLTQPMTALQLGKRLGKSRKSVSDILQELSVYRVVHCLNQKRQRSRLYWVTDLGTACQREIARLRSAALELYVPKVDWEAYGDLLHRHRHVVLQSVGKLMRARRIREAAISRSPGLRLNTEHCREILSWLEGKGLARRMRVRGAHRRFVCYSCTEMGETCQELLRRAQTLPPQ